MDVMKNGCSEVIATPFQLRYNEVRVHTMIEMYVKCSVQIKWLCSKMHAEILRHNLHSMSKKKKCAGAYWVRLKPLKLLDGRRCENQAPSAWMVYNGCGQIACSLHTHNFMCIGKHFIQLLTWYAFAVCCSLPIFVHCLAQFLLACSLFFDFLSYT